jgi:hypothetical protein
MRSVDELKETLSNTFVPIIMKRFPDVMFQAKGRQRILKTELKEVMDSFYKKEGASVEALLFNRDWEVTDRDSMVSLLIHNYADRILLHVFPDTTDKVQTRKEYLLSILKRMVDIFWKEESKELENRLLGKTFN